VLSTLQKFLNLAKEWGKYEVFGVRGIQCSIMSKLKQIRILGLKSLMIASLPSEYKDIL
jgi:hypothetical protein